MFSIEKPTLVRIEKLPREVYILGNVSCISRPIITIVGSRKPSQYGIACCTRIIQSLSGCEVTTCSGLALGIDSLVHSLSLKAGLPTIAIPGSSLSPKNIYPQSNSHLAKQILIHEGCLISPWENQKAAPWTFPYRNTLLAEIANIIVVIEAKEESGSLITASLGMKQGKIICAVPGNIDAELSQGTNALIKQGAHCITSGMDILALLNISPQTTLKNQYQGALLKYLKTPISKEVLREISGYPIAQLNEELSSLEIEGIVTIDMFGIVRRLV